MPTIEDFPTDGGVHCETSTTGALLRHAGLDLSEPMLFGLGEGFGYAVFVMKSMTGPFIGGRSKPEMITTKLAENLGFALDVRETRSRKKAWANVTSFIDVGVGVGVKIDAFALTHFEIDEHFAAHYVAVCGYDDEAGTVDLLDTGPDGRHVEDQAAFEEGRLWKGPMSSNALSWTVEVTDAGREPDLAAVCRTAIANTGESYLNPPIRNFGAAGIRKTAKLIGGWHETVAAAERIQLADLMERGGTGGSLFRVMFGDFLAEANTHLEDDGVGEACDLIREAAPLWTRVAELLLASADEGPEPSEAAEVLEDLADLEERAMTALAGLSTTVG